jgi:hypothetical protein
MDQNSSPVKNKSFFRKYLPLLLVGLALFGLTRVYFRLTDDFRLANITYEMPYQEKWEVPTLSSVDQQKFDEIIKQKFHYIGKGAQSYAFKSDDDQYVIKFFKFKHLKPSLFVDFIPNVGFLGRYKQAQIDRKERLLNSVFDGYRLAYAVHAPETGLIYIHLNKSQNLNKKVTLFDKLGFEKTVNLDEIPFILQVKVETTRQVMNKLMKKQDIAGAKAHINKIFDLYMLEYSKGIYDRDHGVMHNTGFAGLEPIHLDVGKLTKDDRMKTKEFYKPDLQLIEKKFNVWFRANYPDHAAEMQNFMKNEMAKRMGESV